MSFSIPRSQDFALASQLDIRCEKTNLSHSLVEILSYFGQGITSPILYESREIATEVALSSRPDIRTVRCYQRWSVESGM